MNPFELQAATRALLRLEEQPSPLETPCWIWPGARTDGYGRIHVGPSREGSCRVHKLIYRLVVGEVPDGLVLDHVCRVRRCANPAHLEPVTNRENLMRGETFIAEKAAQVECVNGHAFDEENTYERPNGTRACRRCRRERQAQSRASVAA